MANAKVNAPKKRPTPEKRDRINAARAARNRANRSALKTAIKKAANACYVGGADTTAAVRYAIKRVDQACAKGLLHKNCAARKKSQLMKMLNNAK
ncbi:MAG: 30S ribosomal protein S20 [Oscillospiraceae bacterium]|nr:30S ribosomal protein S20 [Oscillospiraceae bacterium]